MELLASLEATFILNTFSTECFYYMAWNPWVLSRVLFAEASPRPFDSVVLNKGGMVAECSQMGLCVGYSFRRFPVFAN